MIGNNLKKALENDINKLLSDYKKGFISKAKANQKLNNLNLLINNNIFNGDKRYLKNEIFKIKNFLR